MRIIQKVRSILIDIPRWGLLGLLVFAPWAYGSTRPSGKSFLTASLLVVLGFFLLSLVANLRLPKLNRTSVFLTVLLLLQGWIMVLNPKQKFEPTLFSYAHLPGAIPWLPGVVDRSAAEAQLLLVTGLIGAFWVAGDLAASARWRTRTWWVMSLTGISLVALGLAQRFTGARAIFWDPYADTEPTFFATYRYHANAGAFLNLVLPLIAARAVLSFLRRYPQAASMTFWSVATLTTVACAFINVSKAAMVITALIVLAQASRQLIQFPIEFRNWSKTQLIVIGVVFLVLLSGLIWAFGFGDSLERWIELRSSGTGESRLLVDAAIVRYALPASGWWGFGPGTFQITFPFFTQSLGNRLAGIWQNAHEDYLQGLMEWGYIGGVLWATLLFGGLCIAIARYIRQRRSWDDEARLLLSAYILSMCGLLLHATVDFPLQIPSLQLYAAVILGFLWNLSVSRRQRKRIAKTRAVQEASAPEWQPAISQAANQRIYYRDAQEGGYL
jgi:O-antigen ligase